MVKRPTARWALWRFTGKVLSGLMTLVMFFTSLLSASAEPNYFRSNQGQADGRAPSDLSRPLWRTELPSGHSSPCPFGDQLVLTTFDAATEKISVVALDPVNGDTRWQREVPTSQVEPFHRTGSPAAATPASDGERVYVFVGSYGLLAYDRMGRTVWSKSMGPFQDEFGSASSPILAGDMLLLNEDHDTSNALYAFEKSTGELLWKVDRNEFTRSYSTPVMVNVDGQPQVLVAGALTLTGYDLHTGERRWWVHGLARIVNPTPVVVDQVAFVPTWSPGGDAGERIVMDDWTDAREQFDKNGDQRISLDELSPGPVLTRFYRIDINQDGGLDAEEWAKQAEVFERARNSTLAIRLGGEGDLTESNVLWSYDRGVPYVASPVCHQGVVFLVKDGGILTTLDAETGKPIKQGRLPGRGNYYASPVVADGKVYLGSEAGVLSVVSAEGEWRVISKRDYGEAIYATPVIEHDRMYVRTAAALYCYSASDAGN